MDAKETVLSYALALGGGTAVGFLTYGAIGVCDRIYRSSRRKIRIWF